MLSSDKGKESLYFARATLSAVRPLFVAPLFLLFVHRSLFICAELLLCIDRMHCRLRSTMAQDRALKSWRGTWVRVSLGDVCSNMLAAVSDRGAITRVCCVSFCAASSCVHCSLQCFLHASRKSEKSETAAFRALLTFADQSVALIQVGCTHFVLVNTNR